MFAFEKNRIIASKIETYLQESIATMDSYQDAILYLSEHGPDEQFRNLSSKTHRFECRADDIRHEIELEMFKKSLLPETREDLLVVLENLDKVPTLASRLLSFASVQKTVLYPPLKQDIQAMAAISVQAFALCADAMRDCLGKRERVNELSAKVDDCEHIGDELEQRMVEIIFSSKLSSGDKLLQKEFVVENASLCDLTQDAIDRIVITAVKRQI